METQILIGVIVSLCVITIVGFTKWGRERVVRFVHALRRSTALYFVPLPRSFRWTVLEANDGTKTCRLLGHWNVAARGDETAAVVRTHVRHQRRDYEGSVTALEEDSGLNWSANSTRGARWPVGKNGRSMTVEIQTKYYEVPVDEDRRSLKARVVFIDSAGNTYRKRAEFTFED